MFKEIILVYMILCLIGNLILLYISKIKFGSIKFIFNSMYHLMGIPETSAKISFLLMSPITFPIIVSIKIYLNRKLNKIKNVIL